jgi:hypothetical protein
MLYKEISACRSLALSNSGTSSRCEMRLRQMTKLASDIAADYYFMRHSARGFKLLVWCMTH